MESERADQQWFRLWIVTCPAWRPAHWSDLPPDATALEPIEQKLCSADEAALFLSGFNSALLDTDERLWAVAVPVHLRYEGDVAAGESVRGFAFAAAPEP